MDDVKIIYTPEGNPDEEPYQELYSGLHIYGYNNTTAPNTPESSYSEDSYKCHDIKRKAEEMEYDEASHKAPKIEKIEIDSETDNEDNEHCELCDTRDQIITAQSETVKLLTNIVSKRKKNSSCCCIKRDEIIALQSQALAILKQESIIQREIIDKETKYMCAK